MASLASCYWGNHLSAWFYHEHCQGHHYHHQYLNDDDREDEFGFWYLQDYLGESGWGMYWKWHKGGQSWGISELNQSLDYIRLKWCRTIIIVITVGIMVTFNIFGDYIHVCLQNSSKTSIPKSVLPNVCDKMSKVIVLTRLFITMYLSAQMMLHDDLLE